ncbi:putative E3 ubiquitin-protein ligase RF298 isoform X1 [Ipomoea triloba]|uniref:putative E3 ubiquitin-protein ligase RF298 isoform X1 n=1 Tax=Ipomoea triloba TaxID=35885 RepID=UPI00125E8A65|nr:putative E3 ubiquitin-protein ligase RF298 isoform X1 [Ipomoea triloba]
MASMVAKACSNNATQISALVTVSEKGSRNKRKFRADSPLCDPNKITSAPQNEFTSYKFSVDKFGIIPSFVGSNGCDTCSVKNDTSEVLKLDIGLSCAVGSSEAGPSRPREEPEVTEEFHDADWSDLIESQLEELILSNLDAIFRSAIKKIVACGYSEEIANKAVLRSGICYGCKDIVSNIVDNTLAFLRNGQEIDLSVEHYFDNLQQMEKYVLAELVCLLREVRPFFSTGDAMWCLLICDMNVSQACAMDSDPLSNSVLNGVLNHNPSAFVQPQLKTDGNNAESNTVIPCKPIPSVYCPSETPNVDSDGHRSQSGAPTAVGMQHAKPQSSFVLNGLITEKESSNSLFDTADKSFSAAATSHPSAADEKFVGNRKVSGTTRREYVLRQKSIHLEKHYKTYGSKGSRAGKVSGFGGLILDKKLKSVGCPAGLNIKNASLKFNKSAVAVSQDNVNHNCSTNSDTVFPSTSLFGSDTTNATSALLKPNIPSLLPPTNTLPAQPMADTELSLSLPAKCSSIQVPTCGYAVTNEKRLNQWAAQDKKDEMILKLVPRVQELQGQLQEWTEWANQKVMQAARRLSKDKAELKTLRQEKEEVERLRKEKQTLEENTMKKLTEMANALGKASGQVDRANAAVHRLEVENAVLRREMEAAKSHAAQSAVSCQEVSNRARKAQLKFQSWEKQKAVLQDEHAAEKRKLTQLQQELEQSKELQSQLEAKWKQEEKAKEELLTQAISLRKEREQIEASSKSKEDLIKLNAQSNLQKYKDDIEKLEKEISQLRLKTDSSKIAALKRGIDGSYASKLTDFRNPPVMKETHISYISRFMADFQHYPNSGGVRRERECVMCLSEEMSVVFLPCAHQVVCTTCNELHEKQGMKDCPSCRSPIQQRIGVHFARS